VGGHQPLDEVGHRGQHGDECPPVQASVSLQTSDASALTSGEAKLTPVEPAGRHEDRWSVRDDAIAHLASMIGGDAYVTGKPPWKPTPSNLSELADYGIGAGS
jgi:hypothetical protein